MPHSYRLHPLQWVMPVFAMLAAFSGHHDFDTAFALLKPIPVVLLLVCVWQVADRRRHAPATWLLLVGLGLSLQGDVWLLLDSGFIAGLSSFWLAHACYILLFRRDQPWRRHIWPVASCITGCATGALVIYLWHNGLPNSMRLPAVAYAAIIVYMASHALARAATLRTPSAYCVAAGAVVFMFSDAVLAVNRFTHPIHSAQLWILGSYYLAQWLIVYGMLPTLQPSSKK